MAIGSIGTITCDISTFSFFAARVPEHGRPLSTPTLIQESITAFGLDLERWRDRAYRYIPYQFEAWFAFDSYQEAITAVEKITQRWWADNIELTWTLAGTSYTWSDIKCTSLPSMQIQRGYAADATGQSSTTGALLITSWTLQHTKPPQDLI